ncbi:MAG: hypothetical protein II496_07075, partial [Clostridiales bacterium]|nr:hypothetical protein [Clostridiales bacterium]
MDIEAKERSEPNALFRSALRLLRLFLNLTVAIFFCLSFSKIKKEVPYVPRSISSRMSDRHFLHQR